MKKLLIIAIALTLMMLIIFSILWVFHGGADQSKVIIEENTQKNN